jgi:thioester reductase-like protein
MEITDGQGVDGVLNSLAGEFIPKSFSVLAPFGRFLEIGKIDIYGNSKLGLAALKENISYHVIDLGQLILDQPSRVMAIFDELRPRFETGEYAPLTYKVFPITEVVEAFRYMAQGKHIGKNVLSFDEESISIGPCTEEGHLLRSDASYLITGGAGGFGLEVAKWMAEQGARNLVLMSRSGPRDQAATDIQQLRADGITVLDVRGDVTCQDDVQRVIDQIGSECPPLRGVLHAAMVLDDEFIAELDEDRFNRVLHPKMVGAWNLHLATRDIALEHFVCFSSLSAVIGATKQSNYNAGNCFLDALGGHRQALGLPALTVNWGAILGAGFVDRNRKTAEYLDTVGLKSMHVDEALRMLGEMIQRSSPLTSVGRIDWTKLGKLSPAVRNLPTYASVAQERTDSRASVSLIQRLTATPPGERLSIVEDYLAEQVAGVFGIETAKVDRTTPLTNLGLDSLMAVELMNRIESETGTNIPMGGVLNGPNVQELSQTVLDLLIDSTDTSEETGEETARNADSLAPLEKTMPSLAEFPLTAGQRTKLSASQNVACAAILHEKIDATKLREAYLSILDRHPMLRTTITNKHGELIQQVRASDECNLAECDPERIDHQQLSSLIADHVNRPFKLEAEPLARLELFQCDDQSGAVVLSNHPTVADSSSTSTAFRDLLETYRARCAGDSPNIAPEEYTYQDFAQWQQTLLSSDTDGKASSYWIDELSGAPVDVDLPADGTRRAQPSYRKGSLGFELSDELTLRLLALSAEHNVSFRDTLYAAFAALVHRRADQNDILIGYRFDGRSHDELRRVVGPFENWLPTRSQLDINSTFRDFLIATSRSVSSGYQNQHVPLSRLLDRLDMQRDAESLLQVAFAMSQDGFAGDHRYSPFQIGRHGHTFDVEDMSIETIDVQGTCESSGGPTPQFGSDLSLEVGESRGRTLGWWHYNRDLFKSETIQQYSDIFCQLLESVVKNPLQQVSDLLPQIGPVLRVVSADDSDVRRITSRMSTNQIDFELESRLDPEITPNGSLPVNDCDNPRLFLTGATGFIGAYLLVELLNRTSSEVVCLVRAADEVRGLRRIQDNLAGYGLAVPDLENRIRIVIGDLSEPLFGLTQSEFDQLAADVDVLYHNGANVNLALPYAALRDANTLGTREVLRLACHVRTKPTHVVSTFTVHTTEASRGRVVTETDPLPACEELLYGYSQTKWVSEKMIDTARQRGLPVAVYRPGHVIGDSRTGTSNTGDFLHSFVLTCIQLHAAPKRDVELDLTPVNFVASAITELSFRKESLGEAFHLTNPNPVKMQMLMNWVKALQLDIDFVPDEAWRNLLLEFGERVPTQRDEARVLADIIVPRALAGENTHAVHPVFDSSRATAALATSGIECAPVDETLLQTCLEYLQRTDVATTVGNSNAARAS